MRKEELQELVAELQCICNSLSSYENDRIKNLIQLTDCIAKLKSHHLYSKRLDEILDKIQVYTHDRSSLEEIIAETEFLISDLNEFLNQESIFASLKKGYEDLKDSIDEAIPEEMKDACKEKVEHMKDMYSKAEKTVKFKIRNWLLSDDNE